MSATTAQGIGARVARKEDTRFLIGRGTYTDDINRPHQAYVHFVRSPHAHARLSRVDTSAAAAAPGVVAVLTGADVAADKVGGIPCGWLVHSKDGRPMVEPPHAPLAQERVRHVGDLVAMVIANSKAEARAAAALVEIDYDELPAIASTAGAVAPGAPLVWDQAPGNGWQLSCEAVQSRSARRARSD